jgi:hypothetical protein
VPFALQHLQVPRLPVKDAHGNLIVAKEYRKIKSAGDSDEDDSEAEAEVKEENEDDMDDEDEGDVSAVNDEDDEEDEEDDDDDDDEEDDDDDDEDDDGEDAMEVAEDRPQAKKQGKGKEMVTALQKFHNRQQQNEHTKMHIAHLCTKIIEDPEENVHELILVVVARDLCCMDLLTLLCVRARSCFVCSPRC